MRCTCTVCCSADELDRSTSEIDRHGLLSNNLDNISIQLKHKVLITVSVDSTGVQSFVSDDELTLVIILTCLSLEAFSLCVALPVTNQNFIQEEIKSRLNSGNPCYHAVQNILYSCLQTKNVNIKIYKTIILPFFVLLWNLICHVVGRR
jgi:hypothetical protein